MILGVGAISAIALAINNGGDDKAQLGSTASANPSTEASSSEGPGDGSESASPAEEASAESASAGRQECRTQIAAAQTVVKADRTGIGHLKRHLGAHQAWISGQIGEEEKSATYKATRLAGPDDLARHGQAQEDYATVAVEAGDACKTVAGACAKRMKALGVSMAAGKLGIGHWEEHLTNMVDFAEGKFDAARAQELWDQTRADMSTMTDPWNKAERALKRAPRCA